MDRKRLEIDRFSKGAWAMQVTLHSYSGDRVKFSIEDIMPFLNATETNEPLLVRIGRTFVPVYSEAGIPYKFLVIPEDIEEVLNLDLPREGYILIPKEQEQFKMILMEEFPDDLEGEL